MKRSFRFLACIAILILSCLAPEARAQFGAMRAMISGMSTPNVTGRNLKLYGKVLELTPDQQKAAEDLLAGFEIEYLAAIKRFQEIQQAATQEFAQTMDAEATQSAVQDAIRKFNVRTSTLEKNLLNDVKSLLDSRQMDLWPKLERLHRRMTTINWGSLSGESVDLFDLVDGMRLSPEQLTSISPILAQYDLDLDRELQSRNKLIHNQVEDWLNSKAMDFGPERMERLKKQMADLRDSGRKILDLNKRYAGQLQPLMPQDLQGEFADKIKLSSYPIVYRKSYPMRALEAALKFTDLDAAQRDGLTNIRDAYLRDAGSANDQWAAAITDNELNPVDDNPLAAFMPHRQLPEAIKKAKESREAIDTRTVEAVRAVLTEPQRAKLPENPKYPSELDFDAPSARQ